MRDLHLLPKLMFRGRPPLGLGCSQDRKTSGQKRNRGARSNCRTQRSARIIGRAFRKLHCPIRNRPNPSLAAAAVPPTLELVPAAPVAAPVPISLTPVCSKLVLGKTRALPLLSQPALRCSTQPHGHHCATLLRLLLVARFPSSGLPLAWRVSHSRYTPFSLTPSPPPWPPEPTFFVDHIPVPCALSFWTI